MWQAWHFQYLHIGLRKLGDEPVLCGRRLVLCGRCSTWSYTHAVFFNVFWQQFVLWFHFNRFLDVHVGIELHAHVVMSREQSLSLCPLITRCSRINVSGDRADEVAALHYYLALRNGCLSRAWETVRLMMQTDVKVRW